MSTLGADYSAGRPSGAALAAKGVTTSFRYIRQGSSGKLLTAAEYQDLTAHGIAVVGVSELGIHDMETGRTAGQQAAQADQAWLRSLGIPLTQWACAADEHLAAGGPTSTAVAHAQGYADVLGANGGVYGPIELMTACAADPVARVLWRWLWGHQPTTAQITTLGLYAWQRNTGTAVIGGVTCDLNDVYRVGEDMAATQADANLFRDTLMGTEYARQGPGQTGNTSPYASLTWMDARLDSILAAIAGISQQDAALLTAVQAAGTTKADPAALVAAGLPQAVVTALLATLTKAAGTAPSA